MSGFDPRSVPVRFTNLKNMAHSPARYRYMLEHNERKRCYDQGTAVHTLSLGIGAPVVCYRKRRQGKEWESFEAEELAKGHTILSVKEYDEARAMADAVRADPVAAPYLVGAKEVQVDWENCGRKCSSRIDILGDGFVCDLKTARTSHPERFQSQAVWMAYHAQLAWYLHAARYKWQEDVQRDGWTYSPPNKAVIIAVEKLPPYNVTVHPLSERTIEQGDKLCRAWLERLLGCESSNEWPGYSQCEVPFDIAEQEDDFDYSDGEEEVAGDSDR